MIHQLRLYNFKCFEDQVFQFKPLTLLTGLNSTGKSSVLQSLLLLRQSHVEGLLATAGLMLKGDLVNIGVGKDVLFEDVLFFINYFCWNSSATIGSQALLIPKG